MERWKCVIWSDEATFETGKQGRVHVTRRPDEKACPTCIKSIYRSGRTSVMVWGAIGWDWKSPLIFMEKKPGRKGICSQAYLEQCLETVIFPWYDALDENQKAEVIFIEDRAKVHKGKARLPRLNKGIRGFNWPPSSPDLNPIEKVWRWMKEEITKMINIPTTLEDLKKVLQELWDRVEPEDYRHYTAQLTCKIEDVIKVKGMATIH
jgi:transposase